MGNKDIDVSNIKQEIIYKNLEDIINILTTKKSRKMNYIIKNLQKI